MPLTAIAAALFLLAGGAQAASVVRGTVTDQEGLSVPRVVVQLRCGSSTTTGRTDARGRFTVSRGRTDRTCTLSARHDGFAVWMRDVAVDETDVSVSLVLARHEERIIVRPASPVQHDENEHAIARDELNRLPQDTAELVRYALLKAGRAQGDANIYVDGLPAGRLPPSELVSRISVNADPFSPEFTDGSDARVEIVTGAPDRKIHFRLDGNPASLGGRAPGAGSLRSSSSSLAPFVSGAVAHLPVTFAVSLRRTDFAIAQSIEGAMPDGSRPPGETGVLTRTRSTSGTLTLAYAAPHGVNAAFSVSNDSGTTSNAGAGGLTQVEAASGIQSGETNVRASVRRAGPGWSWQAGAAMVRDVNRAQANSASESVVVPGYVISGGAPSLRSENADATFTAKFVARRTGGGLPLVGVVLTRASGSLYDVPNPSGILTMDPSHLTDASVTSGIAGARGALVTVSPFYQQEIWRTRTSLLTAGVRADMQSKDGVVVSPRTTFTTVARGFMVTTGAGLFVQSWPEPAILGVRAREAAGSTIASAGSTLRIGAALDPSLTRRRELMAQAAVDRQIGPVRAGLQYSWAAATHLLGSSRQRVASGWLDVLESNRGRRRNEMDAHVSYHRGAATVRANYSMTASYDDTDGPLSFPAVPGDLADEWARSTGVAPRTASLAATIALPGRISATATGVWRAAAPYTILTGRDGTEDGLFNDRGGLARNSADGPSYRDAAVYVLRRISIAELSVRVDNLFDAYNAAGFGNVAGSPLLGRPVGVLPGRTIAASLAIRK